MLVVDLGGQYSQLIARRIRECGVFSELLPHDVPLDDDLVDAADRLFTELDRREPPVEPAGQGSPARGWQRADSRRVSPAGLEVFRIDRDA